MKTCDRYHWYRIDVTPCKVYDGSGCENWQPETNYDKIRCISDAGLAELLHKLMERNILSINYVSDCKSIVECESKCPVGGVDRSGAVDKISIQAAMETPFWLAIYATEPTRDIDVRMSYSDLKTISDLVDEKRMRAQGFPAKAYHVYYEDKFPNEADVFERTVLDLSITGKALIKEDDEWVDFEDPAERMFWKKEEALAVLNALKMDAGIRGALQHQQKNI